MKKHPESWMMSHGYNPKWSEGSVKTPIFQTSTFAFNNSTEGKRFFALAYGKDQAAEGEQLGLIYSRLNNPNMQILEERLSLWEGADEAAAFESGMSAIATTMLAYLKPGDVVLFSHPTYGGTHHFVHQVLVEFGIERIDFDPHDTYNTIHEKIEAAQAWSRVKMVYVETPANPTNDLFDLEMLNTIRNEIQLKGGHEVIFAVDNTYMGPLWQKPMDFGADVVCYSATKYLSGHSDLIAGVVVGKREHVVKVKTLRTFLGNMIAPYTAWLLTRSIETLKIRMDQQAKNALDVVAFLEAHPKVSKIYFPGSASQGEKQVALFQKQCSSAGAMISFDVVGGEEGAFRVLDHCELIKLAVSLGSNESLAQHPFSMTHADVADEEKIRLGITEGMIRLSVGIENSEDIIADLKQALEV
ncbi:MAG: cystathionine gamma-synthase family protein [Bacteroidetes bacterium]|nr:cystathionine gamma-synthase family protein [Bacteroidota bacterium]